MSLDRTRQLENPQGIDEMRGDLRTGVLSRDRAGHGHHQADLVLPPVPAVFGLVVAVGLAAAGLVALGRDGTGVALTAIEDLQATAVGHHGRHSRRVGRVWHWRLALSHQRQRAEIGNSLIALLDSFPADLFADPLDLLGGDIQP